MLSTIAALIFVGLATLVGVFQLALVLGAPWGEATMGGRYKGAIPRHIRVVPLASAALIFCFAVIVLTRAGLALGGFRSLSTTLIWAVVLYCSLGAFLNFVTPSKRERALWFPVVAIMLICSLIVTLL
ncbi:MAG: hypothetical protein JWR22_1974 [Herminiimonas sp.]|nr:hypothetical protein [Herminiimonas sp.]